MLNALGVQNGILIPRIDYSKRNKLLDSSVVNLSSKEIQCKIKNIKITKALDSASNLVNCTKRLTGVLIIQKSDFEVATNDVIKYKGNEYVIQTANPLNEDKLMLISFKKYYIEALG